METPTGVDEETSVETEGVLVEAFRSPASRLDVTSAGIPARFRLNQTEVSQSCAAIVSEGRIPVVALSPDVRLIEIHRLEVASTIDKMIDQSVDLP